MNYGTVINYNDGCIEDTIQAEYREQLGAMMNDKYESILEQVLLNANDRRTAYAEYLARNSDIPNPHAYVYDMSEEDYQAAIAVLPELLI